MPHKKSGLLLITKEVCPTPRGGRDMLSVLNRNALSAILGEQLIVFELPHTKPVRLSEILNAFRGHLDGLTSLRVDEALELIKRKNLRKVFVDGSNLGGFVARIKRTLPEVEVITFFHNVEFRFFWGALKAVMTTRALAILAANYLAERKATRLSDKRICLSERDSNLLQTIYGRAATHILPIALEDKLPTISAITQIGEVEPFALFVGGDFYANRQGISWFMRHVSRRVNIKVYVVGKGMESMRGELSIPGRLEVIGSVDNLAAWYERARFVIAPIFDGSGMKTKVAEALMYGKKVVGTPEAFSGYEDIVVIAGWLCRNAEEFSAGMQAAQRTINLAFDPALRELYNRRYSLPAATERLSQLLSV
jgi:glycosyltransferase involved in cell wall biosynthesis